MMTCGSAWFVAMWGVADMLEVMRMRTSCKRNTVSACSWVITGEIHETECPLFCNIFQMRSVSVNSDIIYYRVWDYVGDNFVHRLVQSTEDGKLVEQEATHEGGKHNTALTGEGEDKIDSLQLGKC